MSTYPLHEDAGLYLDSGIIPYIMLSYDRMHNAVPENVRILLDIGKFDNAVRHTPHYTVGDAARDYPAHAEKLKRFRPTSSLYMLLPDDYINGDFLFDVFRDLGIEGVTVSEFDGTVETVDKYKVPNYVDVTLSDDYLYYLAPRKDESYFARAYRSVNELIAEYRNRFADAGVELPDNLDLRRLVCTIDGTYFY